MKAELVINDLHISFGYDPVVVNRIKSLPKRRWSAEKKIWVAPVSVEAVNRLIEWGFVVDQKAIDLTKNAKMPEAVEAAPTKSIKQLTEIPGLKKTPFQYQLEGVSFIDARNGRALVADEMGLGKTCQALAYLQLHPEIRPAVIVVPASLKLNWGKEIKMWMSSKSKYQIISGKYGKEQLMKSADIYIVNYDILAVSAINPKTKKKTYACRPDILDLKPQMLIMDEVHACKNGDAQRTKACLHLAKEVKGCIGLSGTPILNKPVEIYNSIVAVDPKLFPSFWKFAHRYCGAKHNGYGWDFNGSSNTKELNQILTESIMIRRLKKDVLKDLPEKTRAMNPMEIDNRKEYTRAENEFIAWVKDVYGKKKAEKAEQAETLVKIGELKRLAVRGKLEECVKWIEDFLESDEKLVVFAIHAFVIEELMGVFGNIAVKVDGSVSVGERQRAVDAFQTNENTKLFIGNIQAAGVGLTLTAASNVCFLELPWVPGFCQQAEDRCHRIGQKDNVAAWYLLAEGTIEEDLAQMIDRKLQIISQVLDGVDADESSMLTELLNRYREA